MGKLHPKPEFQDSKMLLCFLKRCERKIPIVIMIILTTTRMIIIIIIDCISEDGIVAGSYF